MVRFGGNVVEVTRLALIDFRIFTADIFGFGLRGEGPLGLAIGPEARARLVAIFRRVHSCPHHHRPFVPKTAPLRRTPPLPLRYFSRPSRNDRAPRRK